MIALSEMETRGRRGRPVRPSRSHGVIRWGVIGPGAIATGLRRGDAAGRRGQITAVASRSAERAEAFGDRFAIPTRYGDYEALAADPDVDVVYVATPQFAPRGGHHRLPRAGKHVLCEKPFALNAGAGAADGGGGPEPGVVPDGGDLEPLPPGLPGAGRRHRGGSYRRPTPRGGRLRIPAAVGSRPPPLPPELGGGGLLDLGIYPRPAVLAAPRARRARRRPRGSLGETGVDEVVAAVLRHPGGRLGVVKAALRVRMTCTARIAGTEGVHRSSGADALPELLTVATSAGVEQIDALLRGQRTPLRDRGGAPVPRRGEDREPGDRPRRVDRAGVHARRHPGRDRPGLPRESSTPFHPRMTL